jgi:hypothetical protein
MAFIGFLALYFGELSHYPFKKFSDIFTNISALPHPTNISKENNRR